MSETLSNEMVNRFISDGCLQIQSDLPEEYHSNICNKVDKAVENGNPGNNLLPIIPEITEVFKDPKIAGALETLLGPDYLMHPHRYCHVNRVSSDGQNWHKDDYIFDQNTRRPRFRWLIAFYYPHDVNEGSGPSATLPGQHYYNNISSANPSDTTEEEYLLCGKGGTINLLNFDAWHRATPNLGSDRRIMIKFNFQRVSDPCPQGFAPTSENSTEQHPLVTRDVENWLRGLNNPATTIDTSTNFQQVESNHEAQEIDSAYLRASKGNISSLMDDMVRIATKNPALRIATSSANPQGRNPSEFAAALALGSVGDGVISHLRAALEDSHWAIRATAADILGDIGPRASSSVKQIVDLLSDREVWVRRNAAEALAHIGIEDGAFEKEIASALKDPDHRVRRNVAYAWIASPQSHNTAINALAQALRDDDRYVQFNTLEALKRSSSEQAHKILCDNLMTSRWCPTTSTDNPY